MPPKRRIIDDALYAHFVTFSVYRRRRLLDHDHAKRIVGWHRLGVFALPVSQSDGRLGIVLATKLEEMGTHMHLTPVRAGLVTRATDWRWSSARWYVWGRTVGVPIRWVS